MNEADRLRFRTLPPYARKLPPGQPLEGLDVLRPRLGDDLVGQGRGGLFLSQPLAESQSRTNCLSNDGWPRPGAYWSAGQKRELSGVSTSSIRMTRPSTMPHSNFVSAMRMPRCRA